MRRFRSLTVTALGLTVLLVVPALAAPKVPAPLVLRGTTVFLADRTSGVDLVLYDDALVHVHDDYSTPDIALSGKGRIVSVSLTGPDSLTLLRYVRNGKPVLQTQANGSYYPEPKNCHQTAPGLPTMTCDDSPAGVQWARLHQGHYRLRVLTDGSPVTVTIRLQGVAGSARYRVKAPLAGGVVNVPVLSITSPEYQRFETSLKLPAAADVVLNVDANWSPSPAVAGVEWCDYIPTRPALPTDYGYECPGGQLVGGSDPFVNARHADWDPNQMYGLSQTWLGKGSHRLGFSAMDSGGVTVRAALVAWLAA
jgi:hypothetical protein